MPERTAWELDWKRKTLEALQTKLAESADLRDLLSMLWSEPQAKTGAILAGKLHRQQALARDPLDIENSVRAQVRRLRQAIDMFKTTPEGRRGRYSLSITSRP